MMAESVRACVWPPCVCRHRTRRPRRSWATAEPSACPLRWACSTATSTSPPPGPTRYHLPTCLLPRGNTLCVERWLRRGGFHDGDAGVVYGYLWLRQIWRFDPYDFELRPVFGSGETAVKNRRDPNLSDVRGYHRPSRIKKPRPCLTHRLWSYRHSTTSTAKDGRQALRLCGRLTRSCWLSLVLLVSCLRPQRLPSPRAWLCYRGGSSWERRRAAPSER